MAGGGLWQLEIGATLVVGIVAWVAYVRSGSVSVRASQRAKDEAGRYARHAVNAEEQADVPLRQQLARLLANWGGKLPLFNATQQGQIAHQLTAGGFRQIYALQAFVAIKVLCGGLGVLGVSTALGNAWLPSSSMFVSAIFMVAGLLLGMLAPEIVLKVAVRRRQKQINRFLSDALDLMVICTNAGYSLSATIRCVAREMRPICRPLAEELEFTFQETQISSDTVAALRNLAERTGVESLRGLVATLIQSYRYGTPMTQALKVLARSERTARLLRLEEQGAKLAVKMTIPMMLLVLPAVMIIVGGPAFLRLSGAFTQ